LITASALASEQLEEVAREKVRLVCISTVPPDGHLHSRYLCKRLREQFPDMKIVAVVLVGADGSENKLHEPPAPADEIATTLAEAVAGVWALLPATASSEQKAFSF
jgi:hypothetical protein